MMIAIRDRSNQNRNIAGLFAAWMGLATMTPCICFASTVTAATADKPNIVLVMADDQGWGQVGYNGHPHLKTPNLDVMAAAGIRFNRFYATPTCSPTRASVLTGRIPARTGVPAIGNRLCLQEKTLPEALKQAGYATALFGKWHLNGVGGRGVPILAEDPNHPGHYGFDEWLAVTNYFDMDPLMSRNGTFVQLKGDSSVLMVTEALKFMHSRKDGPFLVVIWFGSPHFPWTAREGDRRGLPSGNKEKLANHLGEIVALDRSVGMLRQGLRDLGIGKNTLVWYCSDNGGLPEDPDSVGGLRGHKGSLYEGGIRVPCIIEWPGRIKPMITDFPASTMDIMPTIVDLLRLPDDAQLAVRDGESIAALFDGNTPKREHSIPFTSKGRAFIDGNYKLLNASRPNSADWKLYDLERDPGEAKDVAAEHPERFERMKAEAQAILQSVDNSAEGKDYPERKVIQPPRHEKWPEMEAYKPYLQTFERPRQRASKNQPQGNAKSKRKDEQ